MKGVGAEHQMLMSATSICECEHSHLYVSLISARLGRATPFKKRKRLQFFGVEKSRAEKAVRVQDPLGPPHPLYPPLLSDVTEGNNN